jgi:hypothetical protein
LVASPPPIYEKRKRKKGVFIGKQVSKEVMLLPVLNIPRQ